MSVQSQKNRNDTNTMIMDNQNGIEEEKLYENGKEIEIITPFDPRQVDIDTRPMVLSNIVERLKYGEIELNPDFQRNLDLWGPKEQSRLIESLLIRIPLPTFYFDMPDEDQLIVVDGVQRLCAINNFMVLEAGAPNKLRLQGLEYLNDLEGMTYEELAPNLKRRLREQTIQTYVIKAGTPDKVRNSIFERINTGGLVLTPAEIKNSVYRGRASNFVKRLAESKEFINVTRGKIKSERMLDREFVNRFLAFYLLGISGYYGNLDDYLNDVLIKIKNNDTIDLSKVEEDFLRAAKASEYLFGDRAFRKRIKGKDQYGKINKPLYEAVMVQIARKSDEEINMLYKNRERFLALYNVLLSDDAFIGVITNGTASIQSVNYRHKAMQEIINQSIQEEK